jgi:hypothetical protein
MVCPYCGSEKIIVDTPFIDPITEKAETTFCCAYQKTNAKSERKMVPEEGEYDSEGNRTESAE